MLLECANTEGVETAAAEKEICKSANLLLMQPGQSEATRKWYSKGRWAYVLAIVGGVIVAFVASTQGEYGAWTLWIAVPLLMISLGYIYLVNALPVFWGKGPYRRGENGQDEEP